MTARTPPSKRVGTHEGDFESAHEKARKNEFTGVLSVPGGAFAVFYRGVAVYARSPSSVGEDALLGLGTQETVTVSASKKEKVEMFLTYTRYIGDDGVLRVEPVDGTQVDATVLEDILIDGVRKDRAVSWRGETQDTDKSILPEGKVTAFGCNYEKISSHVSENSISGYAVRTGQIATFIDGEPVDRRRIEMPDNLVMCGGWTLVEPNTSESAVASGNTEGTDEPEGDGAGLLGGIFG